MKRELTYIEILNKITEAYFEVLINDEQEADDILKEAKINIAELDKQTNILIKRLNREITIKLNKEKQINFYEKAKEMIKSIGNLDEYFQSLTSNDKQQFEIAFRNSNEDKEINFADFKEEYITLKLMEKLKKDFESRESEK